MMSGKAEPRAAVARPALMPGRPLGVSGNPGNAMGRPVQQATECMRTCHLLLQCRATNAVRRTGARAVAGARKRSIIDREHFRPGRTVDDLFRECLALVIDGATAKSGLTP